jgi:hypothetical protein
MHHNPAKNVLYVRAPVAEIGVRLGMQEQRVSALLDSAREKMYTARKKRPTPYVDKTVYTGWNGLCVSAYLQAARVFDLGQARHFALRSLDRILSQGWNQERGLKHIIAYSDPRAAAGEVAGLLDDYAFVTLACLDAYETTSDLTYFNFARRITDAMIERFYDETSGGFFDCERSGSASALGALTARRKPFQDSPTPAGNSAAAIVLLRMHGYTNQAAYRDKAEETLEVFAAMAEQHGMFAATYGIAAVWLLEGHTQVVVTGKDERARQLYAAAVAPFALNKAVLRFSEISPQNLPPALAETIANLPGAREGKSMAVVCTNFTCRPPITDPDELSGALTKAVVSRNR